MSADTNTLPTDAKQSTLDVAGVHLPRDVDGLQSDASCHFLRILGDANAAVVTHTGDGCEVELTIGDGCPLSRGTTIARDAWADAKSLPMYYRGAQVGELLHDADLDETATNHLSEFLSHYTIALVNLKLNSEALSTTEHYCASLQAFEEGVVLFQERDPFAVGARFLSLLNSLLGTQFGALYVLQNIGDPSSELQLQQLQGLPEAMLEELRTADGDWWPPSMVQHSAGILARNPETGEFDGLSADGLPPAMTNVVHCALRYHGVCVGVALAFNVEATGKSLELKLERARRLGELGAALFHRLSLEHDALKTQEISTQLSIAATIQGRLIPAAAPDSDTMKCAFESVPAQFVGGDYIDLLLDEDSGFHAIVADVSGHGINSALLMASCRAAYRAECKRARPDEVLAKLNTEINQEVGDTGMFITAAALHFSKDGRQLCYASAGHNPLLVYRAATETIDELDSTGPSLGMFPGMDYGCVDLTLNAGDVVLLYTDGIVEATDPKDEMFDDERLHAALRESAQGSPDEILECVRQRLSEFLDGNKCDDDVSISVIKIT